jgi:predicted ester cyclase
MAIVDELGAPEIHMYYPVTGELRGRNHVKLAITQFRTAFPDASFSGASDFVAEGDYVAARWQFQATQKGALGSIPTIGKTVSWTGINMFRLANGKIVDETGEEDALSLMRQLWVVPSLDAVPGGF